MTAIAACRTCGTEPREGARFCDGCGAPVTGHATHAEYKQVTVLFIAAGRVQVLIESRAGRTSMVQIIAQMDRIIRAIQSTVPEELWPEILRKKDGPVAADTPADEFEDCDQGDDEYDPVESAKAEDCWTACARSD